jgi:hypothetical protein
MMKFYSDYIELWPGKTAFLPGPMTIMEIAHLRFDPGTLLIAAMGAQALGQFKAGQAASAEGKSQQNIANYNAQVQEREAKAIEQRTALEQRRQAEAAARQQSSLEAGLGAAGAVSTAGAPLMLQAKQASESELENLNIGYTGREEATAARTQAQLDRMGGKLARQRGKAEATGHYIGAGTTLLSGFSAAKGTGGNKDTYLAKKHGIK